MVFFFAETYYPWMHANKFKSYKCVNHNSGLPMSSKNAYNTRDADKLFNLVSMWVEQRKPKSQMLIEMA